MTTIILPDTTINIIGANPSGVSGNSNIILPASEFVSRFDDTYWENSDGLSWNSGLSRWDIIDPASPLGELQPVTSGPNLNWQVGYRPSNIRITVEVRVSDGDELTYELSTNAGLPFEQTLTLVPSSTLIFEGSVVFSPDEDITLLSGDVGVSTSVDYSITNIEFS